MEKREREERKRPHCEPRRVLRFPREQYFVCGERKRGEWMRWRERIEFLVELHDMDLSTLWLVVRCEVGEMMHGSLEMVA